MGYKNILACDAEVYLGLDVFLYREVPFTKSFRNLCCWSLYSKEQLSLCAKLVLTLLTSAYYKKYILYMWLWPVAHLDYDAHWYSIIYWTYWSIYFDTSFRAYLASFARIPHSGINRFWDKTKCWALGYVLQMTIRMAWPSISIEPALHLQSKADCQPKLSTS